MYFYQIYVDDDYCPYVGSLKLLEKMVKENYNIIFNGDGYSEEWVEEAEKRGLPNIKTTAEAIKVFNDDKYVIICQSMTLFLMSCK